MATSPEPTTTDVLFLQLSQYHYDSVYGIIMGLSVDKNPSEAAVAAAAAAAEEAAAIAPPTRAKDGPVPEPYHAVTLSAVGSAQATVVALRVRPRDQDKEGEGEGKDDKPMTKVVVLTVSRAKDENEYFASAINIGLDIMTTKNGELSIKALTERVHVMLLTPVLARKAPGPGWSHCQALMNNKERCVLRTVEWWDSWCPFHREYHQLLHDEKLKAARNWTNNNMHWSARTEEQIIAYNQLQALMAVRPMITEILYPDNPDEDPHRALESALENRGKLESCLQQKGCDGLGRVPIESYMNKFLSEARKKETNPQSRCVWLKELIVDLAHVRELQRFEDRDGQALSVCRFFDTAKFSGYEMRDRLYWWADKFRPLPIDLAACNGGGREGSTAIEGPQVLYRSG